MSSKRRLVILTGAGMSAESGIRTFRDNDGLWEEHDVTEVATPMAWARDPVLVQRFYNERRKQLYECRPNRGHTGLAALEKYFDVHIITQNIDDLHEQAGSTNVLHLHGELKKSRSSVDPSLVYDIDGWELKMGDKCERGSQLRPHIVWFGEAVPAMEKAAELASSCEIFVVVGTSLNVYPAAGLLGYAPRDAAMWLIDPNDVPLPYNRKIEIIKEKAEVGVDLLSRRLLEIYGK
jgi:NAD-dependent deacetylase